MGSWNAGLVQDKAGLVGGARRQGSDAKPVIITRPDYLSWGLPIFNLVRTSNAFS